MTIAQIETNGDELQLGITGVQSWQRRTRHAVVHQAIEQVARDERGAIFGEVGAI